MKFEFATNPDWGQLDTWRREMPTGDAYLLEPASGKVLDPRLPHEWLRDDDRLSRGYVYLAQHGMNIKVTPYYIGHEKAEDLGGAWYDRQVAACDVYAFEAHAWQRTEHHTVIGGMALGKQYQASTSFHQRWLEAVVRERKPSFSFDVEDTPAEIDRLLIATCQKWYPAAMTNAVDRNTLDWICADNAMREWYMVGKLGYELEQFAGQVQGPLSVFMHVGALHNDLTRKFRSLGVQVDPKITKRGHQAAYAYRDITRAIGGSLISSRLRLGHPA